MSRLGDFICPIYSRNVDGGIEMTGTGTLVKLNGIYFVITAAHVLRSPGYVEHGVVTLSGQHFALDHYTSTNGDQQDKLDFAIIELTDDQITVTRESWKFYSLEPVIDL